MLMLEFIFPQTTPTETKQLHAQYTRTCCIDTVEKCTITSHKNTPPKVVIRGVARLKNAGWTRHKWRAQCAPIKGIWCGAPPPSGVYSGVQNGSSASFPAFCKLASQAPNVT